MAIGISRAVLEAILADTLVTPGLERCGLLLGLPSLIDDWLAATNCHLEPERHFELDPAVLIAAERAARAGGPAVLGHYHSHPAGPAIPSVADAMAALPDGRLWMIVGNDGWRVWRSVADGEHLGRFDPMEMQVSD